MASKRGQNEQSKKNLAKGKKFTGDYQPKPERKSNGKRKANALRKEIEKSAEILKRLLAEEIENPKTGQVLTKKEAMLYGVLVKAIKEHDLKAVELILKLIGELDNKVSLNGSILNILVADDEHKKMLEDL